MGSAILFSKIEAVASEFPGYVSELQVLFVRHGMGVGCCEAVGELAAHLRERGSAVREDLASMLGLLFLDNQNISYLEVLGLLLAAAAGQRHAEELAYAPGLGEAVQELFSFVVKARPSREDREEIPVTSFGDDAFERLSQVQEEFREDATETTGFVEEAQAAVSGNGAGGSALARALALSADEEEFGSRSLGRLSPVENRIGPVLPRHEAPSSVMPHPSGMPQRSRMYAAGAGGVVLGLLLGLLVGRESAERTARPRMAEQVGSSAETARDREAQPAAMAPESHSVTAASVSEPEGERGKAEAGASETHIPATLGMQPSAAPGVGGRAGGGTDPVRAVTLTPAAEETHGEPTGAGRVEVPRVEVGSAGIMSANLLASPVPAYPPEASAARVEGEVVVSAVVGRDGSILEARVVSGPPALCEAARQAVQTWRFQPYEIGGKAVEIITTARVDFHLNAE